MKLSMPGDIGVTVESSARMFPHNRCHSKVSLCHRYNGIPLSGKRDIELVDAPGDESVQILDVMFSHLADVVTGSLQSLSQAHQRSGRRRDNPLSSRGGEIRASFLAQCAVQFCRDTSGADKSVFPYV
jgi:hypothetical protein